MSAMMIQAACLHQFVRSFPVHLLFRFVRELIAIVLLNSSFSLSFEIQQDK